MPRDHIGPDLYRNHSGAARVGLSLLKLGVLGALGLLLLFIGQGVQAQSVTPTPPGNTAGEDVLALGARLYAENCVVCHGDQGQGRVGATLDKDWPSIRPELTVRTIIANGVQGSLMPAWSQAKGGPLSEAEIDALVGYILTWQTGGAPRFTPYPTATLRAPITPLPEVQGDPNRGAQLFAENCQMCHGANGEGRIGATLAKGWSGIRPDLSVRTTIANGVSGGPMPAWSTAQGGPLGDSEIDDLTAFVLTLADSGQVVQVSPALPPDGPAVSDSPLSGALGVALFLSLFIVLIVVILVLQRRK